MMMDAWDAVVQWYASLEVASWGVWTLTLCLLLLGLLGTVVPLLPGPLILFVAGALHTWLLPEEGMSWWGLGLLFLLLVASFIVDFLSGAVGSKWFGGSRWGFWGVLVGGVVGLFFGPLGLLVGPLVGGFAFEMLFAKQQLNPAIKATWGTVVGTTLGLVLKLGLSGAMIACFFVDVLWW